MPAGVNLERILWGWPDQILAERLRLRPLGSGDEIDPWGQEVYAHAQRDWLEIGEGPAQTKEGGPLGL